MRINVEFARLNLNIQFIVAEETWAYVKIATL